MISELRSSSRSWWYHKDLRKGYIDDGPVALYYALKGLLERGGHTIFRAALVEVERLYGLEARKNESEID